MVVAALKRKTTEKGFECIVDGLKRHHDYITYLQNPDLALVFHYRKQIHHLRKELEELKEQCGVQKMRIDILK